jgi:hypothetical protein
MILGFAPGEARVQNGQRLTVAVEARKAADLASAPFQVVYDNTRLRLVDIQRGEFLGGQPVSFVRDVNTGVVKLSRLPGSTGTSGDGPLVTLTFEALSPGTATVTLDQAAPLDSQSRPIAFTASPLKVTVE